MNISIKNNIAILVKEDTLVEDSKKTYTVNFEFDSSWDEIDKAAVFKAGPIIVDDVEITSNACSVPAECLKEGGFSLYVGVRKTEDEEDSGIIWCNAGRIMFNIVDGKGGKGGDLSLPEVTSEDNGDVLTVVDGQWGKATPSGGDNTFFITPGEYNSDNGFSPVDKTVAEILDAIDSGKNVYLIAAGSGGPESGVVYYLPFMGGIRARVGSESIPTGALQAAYFWLTEAVVPGGSAENFILQTRYTLALTYTDARLYKSTSNIVVPRN